MSKEDLIDLDKIERDAWPLPGSTDLAATCSPCNKNCAQGDRCPAWVDDDGPWYSLALDEFIGYCLWFAAGLFLFIICGLTIGALLGGGL